MKKVSVIIPVYKAEEYIGRCIESVLAQTHRNLEIVLVDDCSPDRSMAIATECIDRNRRKCDVKIITLDHNQGQSAARNAGIAAATGDYIYFLDSDDYLPPFTISRLMQGAQGCDADFITGNYIVTGGNRKPPRLNLPTGIVSDNTAIIDALYREQWYVAVWNKLIKTDFIRRHNLYFEPGIIHEDDLWTFKLATKARSMAAVNEDTYVYVLHPGATTWTMTDRHLQCRIRVIELLHRYIDGDASLHTDAVVSLFEHFKAQYMRIICLAMHDRAKQLSMYDAIRSHRISPRDIRLYRAERILSFNYHLPRGLGFLFYKYAILGRYKFLMLKAKLRLPR